MALTRHFLHRISCKFSQNALKLKLDSSPKMSRPLCSRPDVHFLSRGDGKKLAYTQLLGDNPGIVFCSGFQSNMQGVKALAIEEYCRKKNLAFVRFDYQGCGQSTGDLREVCMTDWRADVLGILDQVTAGPQILIGSSIGGLLMLYAAIARPHRIHALVGIATAADFPRRRFSNYPKEVLEALERDGEALHTTDEGFTHMLTEKLSADLQNHTCLLSEELIPITCPVRFLHGMRDTSVSYHVALELAGKMLGSDVHVLLRKGGNHRFSQTDDVQIIFEVLDYLVYGAPEARDLARAITPAFTVYDRGDNLVWNRRVLHGTRHY